MMRLPWRAPEGMVWVSRREQVRLLERARDVHEIESEITEMQREIAHIKAGARALRMVGELPREACLALTAGGDVSLDALPLTTEGTLHEEAFMLMIEARIWAGREADLRRRSGDVDQSEAL